MYSAQNGYLCSCTGADIHPGLSCVEPKDTHGSLCVMREEHRDSTIERHGIVQLILENVQIEQPVRVTSPAQETPRNRPLDINVKWSWGAQLPTLSI